MSLIAGMLRGHASPLPRLPPVRLDRRADHRPKDDHGLPLPDVQDRLACAAGRGADSRVNPRREAVGRGGSVMSLLRGMTDSHSSSWMSDAVSGLLPAL